MTDNRDERIAMLRAALEDIRVKAHDPRLAYLAASALERDNALARDAATAQRERDELARVGAGIDRLNAMIAAAYTKVGMSKDEATDYAVGWLAMFDAAMRFEKER